MRVIGLALRNAWCVEQQEGALSLAEWLVEKGDCGYSFKTSRQHYPPGCLEQPTQLPRDNPPVLPGFVGLRALGAGLVT